MRLLAAVTIPIFKKSADALEQISLQQCFKILHKHPIIFFAPASLDTAWYETFCAPLGEFRIERFDDRFFSGIAGYNELMLTKQFYQRFIAFKYILIYQLDAFVFRDELEHWCNKGYFFIGAPYTFVDLKNYPISFLSTYRTLLDRLKWLGFYQYRHVGNGGFSLRSTKKSIELLQLCSASAKNWKTLMEDNFFMYWGNVLFPYFTLAPENEAARFSIELNPRETFELIGRQLPFGCHAFMRYDAEFWKEYIEDEGYSINI